MKKDVLNSFLEKKQTNISEITDHIEGHESNGILLYTSFFENLGNKNSDVDIYVFLPDKEGFNISALRKYNDCLGVDVLRIGELELDIEYWTIESIERIVKKLSDSDGLSGNYSDLKILLRIYHGLFVNSNDISRKILELLKEYNVPKLITNRIALECRSLYDDAIKMYEVGEMILALDCARRCLWECASYMNAFFGKANLKSKWISKIFIDNKAFGNEEIFREYMNLQIYSNISEDNIDEKILEMFSLIQRMMNVGLFD